MIYFDLGFFFSKFLARLTCRPALAPDEEEEEEEEEEEVRLALKRGPSGFLKQLLVLWPFFPQ